MILDDVADNKSHVKINISATIIHIEQITRRPPYSKTLDRESIFGIILYLSAYSYQTLWKTFCFYQQDSEISMSIDGMEMKNLHNIAF